MASNEHDAAVAMMVANPPPPDLTLEQNRERYVQLLSYAGLADDVVVTPEGAAGVLGEWVTIGERDGGGPTILYVHGGGFLLGNAEAYRCMASWIARRAGAAVFIPNYRLAPENPYPDAIDDMVAVYRWLIEVKHVSPGSLVVAGDSAGGGLAGVLLREIAASDLPQPAAAVLLSPWIDLTLSAAADVDDPVLTVDGLAQMRDLYLNGASPSEPRANAIDKPLAGLPPLLIQVGSRDLVRDDGVRFAARAIADGVDVTLRGWKGAIHVFHVLGDGVPEAREALDQVGAFVRERTA